jgi:hypothetical protein
MVERIRGRQYLFVCFVLFTFNIVSDSEYNGVSADAVQ